MVPPCGGDEEDDLIWGPDPRGMFSIKSAYEVLVNAADNDRNNIWRMIWHWEGPSRIKHFMWIVGHERLLTNAERCRRHLATNPHCGRCP
ncbi:Putative ribonuclease H protein At1g65750 [Linum perenne]